MWCISKRSCDDTTDKSGAMSVSTTDGSLSVTGTDCTFEDCQQVKNDMHNSYLNLAFAYCYFLRCTISPAPIYNMNMSVREPTNDSIINDSEQQRICQQCSRRKYFVT